MSRARRPFAAGPAARPDRSDDRKLPRPPPSQNHPNSPFPLCRSVEGFAAFSTPGDLVVIGVVSVVGAVVVVAVARRVVARWRALVAQRAACPLLDLLEDCPDLFAQEVGPGRYCSRYPSRHFEPSLLALNDIL